MSRFSLTLVAVAGAWFGGTTASRPSPAAARAGSATPDSLVNECASAKSVWIWCDDFEQDRLASYFEYDSSGGGFQRAAGVGMGASFGMRVRFAAGQKSAGALHLAFGRTPQAYIRPVDAGTTLYREIYWRMYLRNDSTWIGGGGDKLSRALSFASPASFAEAAFAMVWSGAGAYRDNLVVDPASGTDPGGNLRTTVYNDFSHMRWLGLARGHTPLFDRAHVGRWYCVEAHVRLNSPGRSDGVEELWLDGQPEAVSAGLNFVGTAFQFGINAVYFENYSNTGSPQTQQRYFDNLVVSPQRIGC